MTRAETLPVMVASALALTAIFGYVLDAAGLGVAPVPVLLLSFAATLGLAWRMRTAVKARNRADALVWFGVVLFVFAAIIRLGWPSLVPPGRGPDLTHHLLLVDYLEQHGQLVHDRALDGTMGEMAHYTPGAHLLAVIAGRAFGVDGLRAFFPLLVLCAALTAGFVFLIARRLQLQTPYAVIAVMLLFLPAQYFYGAFTHDGFLAQTVATFFAVAAWWALVAWDEHRSLDTAVLFSIFLVAVFLSWPVFIGPLVVLWCAFATTTADRTRETVRNLLIGLAPLLIVAAIHLVGRWGWLVIVRTSGAVLQPSFDSIGWLLPLLTVLGISISIRHRLVRTTTVFLFAIVLQAVTLFALAKSQGAHTPYMAFKMVYLAIYPAAVLAAVAIAHAERALLARGADHRERVGSAGWIIAALLMVVTVRPALTAPRPLPVVDLDLFEAGKWTRANVGQTCVDYLVGDAETAYWLHLAVLGNPRASARMQEIDRYDPRAAMGTWITSEGRGYAIADVRQLPDELRSRVEIVRTFGNAVVLRRPSFAKVPDGKPGVPTCYDGRL